MEACCFMYGARTASFSIFLVPLAEILWIRLGFGHCNGIRETAPPVEWLQDVFKFRNRWSFFYPFEPLTPMTSVSIVTCKCVCAAEAACGEGTQEDWLHRFSISQPVLPQLLG